jgi:hypothetical protein
MPETENNPVVDKVRELQRKLWVCAKQSRTRRLHALYDRIYRSDVLREAWSRVRSNGGAAGVDRETLEDIEQHGVDGRRGAISACPKVSGENPHRPAAQGLHHARQFGDVRRREVNLRTWAPCFCTP